MANTLRGYGTKDELKQFFVVKDPSQIQLKGTIADPSSSAVGIVLRLCEESEMTECASKDELIEFYSTKIFMVFGLSNFIDLSSVLHEQETLK